VFQSVTTDRNYRAIASAQQDGDGPLPQSEMSEVGPKLDGGSQNVTDDEVIAVGEDNTRLLMDPGGHSRTIALYFASALTVRVHR
jgi:hypothetical protein